MTIRTPARALRALEDRDGRVCVMTAAAGETLSPQHRQGGAGGRRDKHRLANLLWLDSIANGLIESDPEWQAIAKAWGVKISLHADPELIPVFYRHLHAWFVLEGDERHEVSAAVALDMMLAFYGETYLMWKAIADGTDRAWALAARGI
ncbi:hypothetical protein GCM10010915_12080 [Microbacterium faecale]|uniref:Uncharacterized protein n=1 Tax=Microbacterium faecale TaxID=1804630 RepID=A0A916Y7K3_9MICO|nr:hypothetical protein [Microbacterium faecale]GGD33274.1 hypothetical protein GCM10010915_12080 [Microbacterium faecale]